MHGFGVYEFENGDLYDGEFVNTRFQGKLDFRLCLLIDIRGKLTLANGDVYEGEFKDDVYHGQGTFFDKDSGDQYIGKWKVSICLFL